MQLIISIVTPLDFSRQVEYSCVISLSAAATGGVLKKNAKPIAVTFVVHSRLFATSLLNFGIIAVAACKGGWVAIDLRSTVGLASLPRSGRGRPSPGMLAKACSIASAAS